MRTKNFPCFQGVLCSLICQSSSQFSLKKNKKEKEKNNLKKRFFLGSFLTNFLKPLSFLLVKQGKELLGLNLNQDAFIQEAPILDVLSFRSFPTHMCKGAVVVEEVGQKRILNLTGAPQYLQSSDENVMASQKRLLNIYLSISLVTLVTIIWTLKI